MKRMIRALLVCMICMLLAGGVSMPTELSTRGDNVRTVITVQAKKKINKKFKKAMDEYYKFYKKYCKFMKKYQKSSNTFAMMNDYAKLLKQQKKVDKAFRKWKKKKLNSAELAYYTKINAKVVKLLAQV